MRRIINAVVDRGSFFEMGTLFGRPIITGFARLDGWPIAVVKDHPQAEELYTSIKSAYEELVEEGIIRYDDNRMFLSTDF